MRYAQVQGGTVVTFLEGKPEDFPDLVKAGVLQPARTEVEVAWAWDGNQFTPPPTPARVRVVTPLAFRQRLTPAEGSAITMAAASYVSQGFTILQEMMEDLVGAVEVNLDSADVRQGLDLLIHLDLLNAERAAEILA